jgi:hypothetical protein
LDPAGVIILTMHPKHKSWGRWLRWWITFLLAGSLALHLKLKSAPVSIDVEIHAVEHPCGTFHQTPNRVLDFAGRAATHGHARELSGPL